MAKKRDLKQKINHICGELFAEVVAASLYGTVTNAENTESLLSTIIVTRNDFIKRISHPEPGMTAKKYYDRLIMDFENRVSDIIDQIENLG
jgi:hypothetical protein